ncbi:twin-arginine translocase TatA/TatE family subunit [Eggerthella sinensis]|jgi:sec-independent protein translocase protein TatA|uniref:Translocase n=1 Tax=Eggerthella sinensis TaxID=242230 RepID=A0A3N0J3Q0_9ACTN|nr:twin-arginine translocase TatA/TatE family subunit [Eggerthella sinensis]MCB7036651.1 twin-arginine translocase TatA/TatE family subunit [Eggerthella sinensis]RDB71097.1 translocase [Eggerthella sinensis]RNM43262.1 translocase [Eggerthella sinensis]
MKIFGMGMPELILILVVVLVIFGPKNLPKLGGMLGRSVKKIRGRVEDDDVDGAQTA